jgi:pyridoxine 4-dehydrogenase
MTEATFTLGGEVTIPRMGFGAMRLTGDGVWHWPRDRETAKGVLRSALEHGIRLIDTADAYGPETNEYLIAEVLKDHRPDGVIVATKGGLVRGGPSDWRRDGRPEHLKRAVKNSLRRLEVERIDLYQLHAIDPEVPLEDSLGAIRELQDEGLIRFVGVSNFGIVELKRARQIVDVVSVQNRYNLGDRNQEPVLEICQREGIAFIPWYPLAVGELADEPVLQQIAADKGATPLQIALSWLLHRSPVMLPIPGTSSADHLAENWAARKIELGSDDLQKLDTICPVTPAR